MIHLKVSALVAPVDGGFIVWAMRLIMLSQQHIEVKSNLEQMSTWTQGWADFMVKGHFDL